MRPTQRQIDAAAGRLVHSSRFPTFAGGTYAFSCGELSRGAWLPHGHPLARLAPVAVDVPGSLRRDCAAVAHARVRILIEDALQALVTD